MNTVAHELERAVRDSPSRIFFRYFDEHGRVHSKTFQEVGDMASGLSGGLSNMGISVGDRVAAMMDHTPDYLYLLFACAQLGASLVAINTGQRGVALEHILTSTNPKMIVFDSLYAEFLSSTVAFRKLKFRFDRNSREFQKLYKSTPETTICSQVKPETVLSIMFTSGTTSLPKGVLLGHYGYLNSGRICTEVRNLTPDDVHHNCLPFFHCNPQQLSMMSALLRRGVYVMGRKFSAKTFWQDLDASGATVFTYLGSLLQNLYTNREHRFRKNKIRIASGGGASSIPEIWKAFEDFFDLTVMEGYGLTESNAVAFSNRHDRIRIGTIGTVVDHLEAKVIDPESGQQLPPNTSGVLCLRETQRHSGLSLGYIQNNSATPFCDPDGWFQTGDIVSLDHDGYAQFMGRTVDMFRAGGENVSTTSVESLCLDPKFSFHSAIADCSYVGVLSGFGGEDQSGFLFLSLKADWELLDQRGQPLPMFRVVEHSDTLTFDLVADRAIATSHFSVEDLIRDLGLNTLKSAIPTYIQIVDRIPKTLTGKSKKLLLQKAANTKLAWKRN